MHESFLRHRNFLFLKLATLLALAALLAYVVNRPLAAPNGGTALGYTLGTVGALLIVLLSWLGVRKRHYRSRLGSVRGWTSAHVYLGLALLVIVTLHTGFQFGANVHTAAYVLMLLVIASGVYGIVAYAAYPARITDNRAQSTRAAWLAEIHDLNDQAIKLADAIDPEVHRVVVASVERLRIGGSLRQLLFGRGRQAGQPMADAVRLVASRIAQGDSPATSGRLKQVLALLVRRDGLVERVNTDVQAHARMTVWLYLHVPLTAGLLGTLTAHIVAVFIDW